MGKTFLIIQTAFTGDVVLATALAESIRAFNSENTIDFLVRKGNESLLSNHPFIREVLVWDKKKDKYRNLLRVLKVVRKKKYDYVLNLQRFASTGLLTAFSSAKETRGFNKNPFAIFYSKRTQHSVANGLHEVERNAQLVADLIPDSIQRPKLYPSEYDFQKINSYVQKPYITIAASSVWFTKTFPPYKWVELINRYNEKEPGLDIFLLGSEQESKVARMLIEKTVNRNVTNLCGALTLLQSAALMKQARMNYVNDSAPMHLASALNAPVTAIYCSTIPGFGFVPLSDQSRIIETKISLPCRPCGLHGFKECPLTHFKCAHSIDIKDIVA